MATSRFFRSWLEYKIKQAFYWDGTTPLPDKNKFYALLCYSQLSDLSSKEMVFSTEIIAGSSGYSRFNALFSGGPSYDPGNRRWQMPALSWSASFSEAIQYNSVVLVANGVPRSNQLVSVSPGIAASFVSSVDHELSVNEEVLFTADQGGSMPNELSEQTIYYVSEIVNSTTFRVSTTKGGSAVNTTNSGSSVRLRYAKGILVGCRVEDTLITIPAGAIKSWDFFLTEANYYGIGTGS